MRLRIAVLIACLTTSAAAQDAVGTRIAQSASAAEGLQGPLDGTWELVDGWGRTLFVFQIGNPPTPGEALSCAWRAPDGGLGLADCRRSRSRLNFAFDHDGAERAVLWPERAGAWRGRLFTRGSTRSVSLRRERNSRP